jgi:hypothetical protein
MRLLKRCSRATHRISLLFALSASLAHAQGLRTIDNPDGGQIVYGSVTDQTTPQGAVITALRYTHGSFRDRPQIGTIFQSKDGQTFGVSFTLTAVKLGNKPIAGLVMVSMSGSVPQAAILYDERTRFLKTEPEMIRSLSKIWASSVQSASPSADGKSTGHQAGPQPLRMQSGGDGSAKIGLPADWHVTGVAAGAITAEGPHGETVARAVLYQNIHDPHLRSNLQQFSVPNAPDAIAYPAGGNVFAAFANLTNQLRRIHREPPASFTLISSTPLPSAQGTISVQAIFEEDLNDGKGPRSASARLTENFLPNSPTWMMAVDTSSIPKAYVDAEQRTVTAIINSFGQDASVINGELTTALGNIHETGVRSAQQAADADSRRIASTAAFNQHMDDLSVASKVQQNYTMDRTELRDSDLRLRGAVDNDLASALIRANPDRYQEVPAGSFLKGVDY